MTSRAKTWPGWALLSLMLLPLQAQEAPRFGVQVGLLVPLQGDLRITTGAGLGPSLGLHAEWGPLRGQALRARLDFGFFSGHDQSGGGPELQQTIHTRVRDASLGAEYLFRPERLGGAWAFGAGLYLLRWTVDSSNRLDTAGGSFDASGSTTWTREGLGLLASYRLDPHTDLELGVLRSHYGQENLPTQVATLSLLWRF